MTTTHAVTIKRVYDAKHAQIGDGKRLLVDRLWPRGVAKADLAFDEWAKDLSPSPALRKWYSHDVNRWDQFVAKYRAELAVDPAASALADARTALKSGPVTLLTAVKDVEHSAAVVIAEALAN